MFCPGCGIEEKQANQFCRACGTDLRTARKVLEMPDTITASASGAREEIGRAFAAKIREAQTGAELKIVAEDVLPEIEKFLESPEEKRLRRMRVGTLISLIGLGAMFAFAWIAAVTGDKGFIIVAGLGIVAFFIGLSFVFNGLLLTVPKRKISDKSPDADRQRALDAQTGELVLPEARQVFSSVTENTTQHLAEKKTVER
ncbi:MAG TPA: zinc ribbon domain-containing protein [Pyrinomonadaceae bacterium]